MTSGANRGITHAFARSFARRARRRPCPKRAPPWSDGPPSPHGNSVFVQGPFLVVQGGPHDRPRSPPAHRTGGERAVHCPYGTGPFPPGFDPTNPNQTLVDAIAGQDIASTVVLQFATCNAGGIVNIPFITANANTIQLDAIFWIETVQGASGPSLLLHYTQTIILDFEGIQWPHITLATLIKQ